MACPISLRLLAVFHAASKEVFSVLVCEIHITALHATRQKHAIRVLDHLLEAVSRPLHHGIERLCPISFPTRVLGNIDEIVSKEDPDIIEFKSLRRIYTPNLVDASFLICP